MSTNPMQGIARGGLLSLGLALIVAAAAWLLLPAMPGGEWSFLVRAAVTAGVTAVFFGIGWFITVLRSMGEMHDGL